MITPENQLNLRQRHPDYQKFLDLNEKESERIRSSFPHHLDQKYGEAKLQAMDIFPSCVPHSPVLIFIHGGYWRGLDKSSYSFVAESFVNHLMTVCILNYRLMPQVNMKTLLHDITLAIQWIKEKASAYNGDPDALILSGHSAGGHLSLMSYLADDNIRSGVRAICSLSGLFDLTPIKNSYLNETLELSERDVEEFSMVNKDLSVLKCPTLLSVGSAETRLFIDQSKSLYTQWPETSLTYYECEGLNHYQIVHQLRNEHSPLVQFILEHK